MSELRRPVAAIGDDELGAELRALAAWLDAPAIPRAGTPDPARRARLRIEAGEGRSGRAWWPWAGGTGRGPAWRRSLVLAVVALGVLAAIAGAIGFGVPGIRIIFTGPTPSTSASPQASSPGAFSPSPPPSPTVAPSAGPLGSGLDLGFLTTPSEASRSRSPRARRAGRPTRPGSPRGGSRSPGGRSLGCPRPGPPASACS
jgi:hypothetical protein